MKQAVGLRPNNVWGNEPRALPWAGMSQAVGLRPNSDWTMNSYRQYVTPNQFGARFGPTEQDYAAVKHFARTNGLKITRESASRLLVEVSGPVRSVETAFNIRLEKFKHPSEAREFYAPDTEPTVDVRLAVADVQGLSDFCRPYPNYTSPCFWAAFTLTGQWN